MNLQCIDLDADLYFLLQIGNLQSECVAKEKVVHELSSELENNRKKSKELHSAYGCTFVQFLDALSSVLLVPWASSQQKPQFFVANSNAEMLCRSYYPVATI